jgi:Zn-finger nucleic acid-binding protein
MRRYIYCADSGISLDRCAPHGIWLDDGELAQMIDYMQLSQALRD